MRVNSPAGFGSVTLVVEELVVEARSMSAEWVEDESGLHRSWVFPDFSSAWAFMGRVAAEAERVDHHPDWCNSYNRVRITLISHDVGRVTERDHQLARAIDLIAEG